MSSGSIRDSTLDRSAVDRIEIRALVDEYALAVDMRDGERLSRLFLAEARVIGAPVGEGGSPAFDLRGLAAIATLAEALPDRQLFHQVGTHSARLDGDAATGTTYVVSYHVMHAGAALTVALISYADEFARTADGWRFRSRALTRVWSQPCWPTS